MIIDERDNRLVYVTDYRWKSDRELEDAGNGQRVLAMARELNDWRSYTRIALFDYHAKPGAIERAGAKVQLIEWLDKHHPRCTIVIPTVAMEEDDRADTVCWSAFGAPEGHGNMRSTFFEYSPLQYVTPIFGMSVFLKELQKWQNQETIQRAHEIATGLGSLLYCGRKIIFPDDSIIYRLKAPDILSGCHHRKFIAVDIESIEGTNKITAVGLSDGEVAVSVPVDAYMPYGREMQEPGGTPEQLKALKEVLASDIPKVFHNHTFDVPRLQAAGFKVGGPIHDTFCAMAIAYPELAHGLQTSCAALLSVPPWKSVWHPKLPGITREDIEYWICDPLGLRDYNADDAFYTWHLAAKVLPQVGIHL